MQPAMVETEYCWRALLECLCGNSWMVRHRVWVCRHTLQIDSEAK
jgi:hypothetical protein